MKKIIYIFITIALLSVTLQMYDSSSIWTYIYYFSYLLIPLTAIVVKKKIKVNTFFTTIVIIYAISMIFSGVVNGSFRLLLNAVLFLLFYFSYSIIIPSIYINKTIPIISSSIIISHIPLLIVPLLINGIDTFPYRGIFLNSNAIGILSTTIFALLLANFSTKIEDFFEGKINFFNVKFLSVFFGLIVITALAILSNSRTAFITIIVLLFVSLSLVFFNVSKKLNITTSILKIFGILIIFLLFILILNQFIPIFETINDTVINKFSVRQGNLLSGRQRSWQHAIQEAGLFGNGQYYFVDSVGLGSHNTFINILGIYGWIPVIIFIAMILVILYKAVKYGVSQINQYKYYPILMIITFILLSFGENIYEHISMIMVFVFYGIIANDTRLNLRSKKSI